MPRVHEYNAGTIELCGEEYEYEADFEWDDKVPILYEIRLIKQTCKAGEIWYDSNGHHHSGPKWIRINITDFMSADQIGAIADEISTYYASLHEEEKSERARDRAIERYLDFRANGEYRRTGSMHYADDSVSA